MQESPNKMLSQSISLVTCLHSIRTYDVEHTFKLPSCKSYFRWEIQLKPSHFAYAVVFSFFQTIIVVRYKATEKDLLPYFLRKSDIIFVLFSDVNFQRQRKSET